ncbi:MAG TPA: Na+ dependent nucleoside transporter N-terminal domain-containing protein, partial [Cryomorphaceae bacterium]|nr:Na+ dependent nucleoside transporter N-terminal domain-containing protein [Cryomorphaceae bacterium]
MGGTRAVLLLAAILIPSLAGAQETSKVVVETDVSLMGVLRGLLGVATLLALGWLFSEKRKAIPWSLVFKGLILQMVLALLILKVPFASQVFD